MTGPDRRTGRAVLLVATGAVLASTGTGIVFYTARPPAPIVAHAAADSSTTTTSRWQDFESLYIGKRDAVVRIDVETCGGKGSGTGFFVDSTSIVTAAHVVADASNIRATLGRQELDVQVVGVDAKQDIALLRASDAHEAPLLPLADSDPQVGARVGALGFPAGDDLTLTVGTVSALNRTITWDDGVKQGGLVKTDTAINPGNSGGPLVDLDGRAVGVVVARRNDAENTGYAVGAARVRPYLQRWDRAAEHHPLVRCGTRRPVDDSAYDGSDVGSAPFGTAPFGTPAHVVIVTSKTVAEGGPAAARPYADRLRASGWDAYVFSSSEYSSLRPGYWVAATGPFDSAAAAGRAAATLKQAGFDVAYPRCVGDAVDCS